MSWAVIVHTFNPNTGQRLEAGGSLSSRSARSSLETPAPPKKEKNTVL